VIKIHELELFPVETENEMTRVNLISVIVIAFSLLLPHPGSTQTDPVAKLIPAVREAIDNGIKFYHSISTNGGYVYYYSVDLKERWGEEKADDYTIEVQAPGTPAVGMTMLRAFTVTDNYEYLQAATDAGMALINGQMELGGWDHTISSKGAQPVRVSFDDNQTQGALQFLMELDRHIDDDTLTSAINNGLKLMLTAQLSNGGWPHYYPPAGDYHDYATFNDHGINDCIAVMINAYNLYKRPEYKESLRKAGRFMMISQLPPPQPGWAQQYNEFLQPAWARDFEPPSVSPMESLDNLFTLMDLYEFFNDELYVKPLPDAMSWLDSTRLANGKWPRFVEIGTGKALYYDRSRIRVHSTDELHIERRTGYGYENDLELKLELAKKRFSALVDGEKFSVPDQSELTDTELTTRVKSIIAAQDEQGRWITKNDRFENMTPGVRWNGEYRKLDRISSWIFSNNINTLCEFLERHQVLPE
jgi:hypothetical protein